MFYPRQAWSNQLYLRSSSVPLVSNLNAKFLGYPPRKNCNFLRAWRKKTRNRGPESFEGSARRNGLPNAVQGTPRLALQWCRTTSPILTVIQHRLPDDASLSEDLKSSGPCEASLTQHLAHDSPAWPPYAGWLAYKPVLEQSLLNSFSHLLHRADRMIEFNKGGFALFARNSVLH